MFSRLGKFGVLLALLCVVAAQVHVSVDIDSCLLNGSGSHGAASHNHRCQGCESGTVVLAGLLPSLSPFAHCLRLNKEGQKPLVTRAHFEDRAPRAPPAPSV